MENTNIQEAPIHYNPNQLVTYKVIDLDDRVAGDPESVIHYPTEKVTQIEYAFEEARRTTKRKNELQSQINKIIDNLTEDYWYNPNTDKETILSDICEILNFTPKKTIEFVAKIEFTGSIEIDLSDAEDFNLEEVLGEAYVDINNSDVEIDHYELYDAMEN